MTTTKPDGLAMLTNLEDGLLESVVELSEADLDSELKEMGLDPSDQAAKIQAAVAKGIRAAGKAKLLAAKGDLEKFKLEKATRQREVVSGRALLERMKSGDPELSKMMMAARKGTALSKNDEQPPAEDLADLEKLRKDRE